MADGARERLDLAGAAAGATFAFRLALAIVDACVVSPRGGDTTFSAPPPLEKWACCVSSPAAASAAEKCPCAAERSPVAKYVHPGAAASPNCSPVAKYVHPAAVASAHARAPFSKANVAVADIG